MRERDWLGEKPLYWTKINGKVVQSEDIKELVSGNEELDPHAMAKFLYNQYVPGRHTVYANIYKERPGILMALPAENIINTPVAPRLVALLVKVVDRMLGEGKEDVGVFLSGGLDSSIIASLVKKMAKGKVHTFAVSFPTFSEQEYARQVSEYLGTEHHEVLITPQSALEVVPDLVRAYGEPIGDAATICNYILAREAKKYTDKVFSGDGGDEVFAGYPWHSLIVRLGKLFTMPEIVKASINLGLKMVPGTGKPQSLTGYFNSRARVFTQSNIWSAQTFMEKALSIEEIEYLTRLPVKDLKYWPLKGFRLPFYMKDPLNRSQMFDILNILPEKFCPKAYGSTKLAGVTELSPFQDREVVEFGFRIPPGKKLAGKQGKWILRHAFRNSLPANILAREKQGFGTPVGAWLFDELFWSEVYENVIESSFANEYYRVDEIYGLMSSRVRNYHQANVIWTLYALSSWYDAHVA